MTESANSNEPNQQDAMDKTTQNEQSCPNCGLVMKTADEVIIHTLSGLGACEYTAGLLTRIHGLEERLAQTEAERDNAVEWVEDDD